MCAVNNIGNSSWDLKIHIINFSDMLAGEQMSKCQPPLWFSHWNEVDMGKYPNRETKTGKESVQEEKLFRKKVLTYRVKFFHEIIFSKTGLC